MPVSVYKLTCAASGKSYIGITIRKLKQRWASHVHDALTQKRDTFLGRAIRKHGAGSFSMTLLQEVETVEQAALLERALIAEHGTLAPGGYNLTTGGEIVPGWQMHRGSVEKRNAALRGRKHSLERKQHLSRIALGRVISEETRRKISASGLGKRHTDAAKEKCRQIHLGKPKSEEMKRKLSLAKMGIPRSPESIEKQRISILARYAANPKTHCKRGHEFTPENTYSYPTKSGKECKTCMRMRHASMHALQKRDMIFGGVACR